MRAFLRRIHGGWMAFAHALGRVQTYLILSVIYFVPLGLTAPLVRLFLGNPLHGREGSPGSAWTARDRSNLTLDEARRLF